MKRWTWLASMVFCGLSACQLLAGSAEPVAPVKIVIDTAAGRPTSPLIFGFGSYMDKDREKAGVWAQKPSLYRWGGNSSERYNWQLDATNSGNDYFYMNHGFGPGGNVVDRFMRENLQHQAASSITLPLIGWVAKDQTSASFPRQLFPQQQTFEAYGKDLGNGMSSSGRPLDGKAEHTSRKIGPEFSAAWVEHLKTGFGPYPHFYILGNEPMLWGETHRDVHAKATSYDEYLQAYLRAATAVRKADPAAVLIGPADWGWLPVFKSQLDLGHGGGGKDQDRKAHGDVPFLEWFLRSVKAQEDKLHVSLLDVLDMHYYPADLDLNKDEPYQLKRAKERIQATRALWDRQYKETGWINQEVYFLPLLKDIVQRTKPGLKLAIGEYNFRGEQDIGGAIALAEVLRIYIDQDVYMAQYWTEPPAGSPAAAAFRLFRNYDDHGGAFGRTYLATNSPNTGDLTVVAAKDQADAKAAKGANQRVTIVLINKSATDYQRPLVAIDHQSGPVKSVTSFALTAKDPEHLQRATLPVGREVRVALPPLSAMLLEFAN